MGKQVELDPKNTTSKETIRKKIRHALSSKSTNKFPNIDLYSELFDPVEDPVMAFTTKFKKEGGKFIPCKSSDFFPLLLKLIEKQQYNSILASDDSLIKILKDHDKNVSKMLFNDMPADAAIFRADLLIARTASLCFTQKTILYPSVINLSKNVIVVASPKIIVPDFKTALMKLEEKSIEISDIVEIVVPNKPQMIEEREEHTPSSPNFILFMVL